MRVGATIFNQNFDDWDRYEAEERGEKTPARPKLSDRQIFREELNLAQIADGTGFDSVWTIEHHFTPYTMVTNPLQYLTYLAGVTKNVDLGTITMVIVLPWHNPVRIAEDVNMLDAFLGPKRKVIAGVGRGLGRREYAGLMIDQNEARGRFDESIQLLKKILKDGECEKFHGEHFNIEGLRLRPQLERDLSENLWCAGGTQQTVEIIAKHDVKPLTIPTVSLDLALSNLRTYANLRRDAGHKPTYTKLALWTYVAETKEEADKAAERYMVEYAESAVRHYELLGTHFKNIKGYEHYGSQSSVLQTNPKAYTHGFYNTHPWGAPDDVIKRTKELALSFGVDENMFVCKYGAMPIEMAEKSMKLFAKEVLPALHEIKAEPMDPAKFAA